MSTYGAFQGIAKTLHCGSCRSLLYSHVALGIFTCSLTAKETGGGSVMEKGIER